MIAELIKDWRNAFLSKTKKAINFELKTGSNSLKAEKRELVCQVLFSTQHTSFLIGHPVRQLPEPAFVLKLSFEQFYF